MGFHGRPVWAGRGAEVQAAEVVAVHRGGRSAAGLWIRYEGRIATGYVQGRRIRSIRRRRREPAQRQCHGIGTHPNCGIARSQGHEMNLTSVFTELVVSMGPNVMSKL